MGPARPATMPYAAPDPRRRAARLEQMREMRWLTPSLVAQIRFVQWTADGHLRHAAFLGLRFDKPARRVRRETCQQAARGRMRG